jgi:RHS repeat-associated protein
MGNRSKAHLVVILLSFAIYFLYSCSGGSSNSSSQADSPALSVSSSVISDTDSVYATGSIVRINIETPNESSITNGTIRITSTTQNYDSGILSPSFGSIFYMWDTTDLSPSDDYIVNVSVTNNKGETTSDSSLLVTLTSKPPSINKLVSMVDLNSPSAGFPVSIVRSYLLDSSYEGPIGYGWTHSYKMRILETPTKRIINHQQVSVDGYILVFNKDGTGTHFKPNGDGTYQSPGGDYRSIIKSSDGSYLLREKSGTTYLFDSAGMLSFVEDRNGNKHILTYDPFGRLSAITDSNEQATTFVYDNYNRVRTITSPLGKSVTYGYDTEGNLISVTNYSGQTTTYTYDANHNLSTITDVSGKSSYFTTDSQDRLATVSGENGDNRIDFSYNTPNTNQMTMTDGLGNQTILTYDNHSRVTQVNDPLGNITQLSYDANNNLISLSDETSGQTYYAFDEMGNLLTRTDAEGNITTLTYEKYFHQVASLTDAKGQVTFFEYDTNGNLSSTIYPDGSSEYLTYDNTGNLTSKTDRKNQTITFTYDTLGRLIEKAFPNNSTDVFTYDSLGNLVSVTDVNGTIEFTYDSLDRVIEVTYPGGNVVSYAYDNSNNRTHLIYPNGKTLNYSYDSQNRLTRISESGQTIASYSYDAMSRVSRRDFNNETHTTYTYDNANHLFELINRKSSGDICSSYIYTYDNRGNRTSVTTLQGTTHYTYDAISQLISVTLPDNTTTNYNLDSAGNRNTVTDDSGISTYTTNNLNQYTNIGGDTFTYDANGNMTSKTTSSGTTSYNYDYENLLTEVTTPMETISYTYDPFGRRISKTTSSGTTRFIHDGFQVVSEIDDIGTVQATYIYGIGIDELLVMERSGNEYFYNQDGLNSIISLSDSTGNVIESYKYNAYGIPDSNSEVGNTYLFAGREYDSEFESYYYRARYYDPILGRFYSTDPVGFTGNNNLYSFVNNNPINKSDPFGLQPIELTPNFVIYRDLHHSNITMTVLPTQPTLFDMRLLPGLPTWSELRILPDNNYWPDDGLSLPGNGGDGGDNDICRYCNNLLPGTEPDFCCICNASCDPCDMCILLPSSEQPSFCCICDFSCDEPFEDFCDIFHDASICNQIQPDPGTPSYCLVFPEECMCDSNDTPEMCLDPCVIAPETCVCQGIPQVCAPDPTFIQVPRKYSSLFDSSLDINVPMKLTSDSKPGLFGKITIPVNNSLLRANIPIFGLAYGKNFKQYIVEYGMGTNPDHWIFVASSTEPQTKTVTPEDLDDTSNTTIHGNLATWDTGLKNYVYLPSHPADHPIYLQGTHTIRLVVEDNDGNKVEDRKIVELASVIPNAWGGNVLSNDGKIQLSIPEQALRDSFRLISIQPTDATPNVDLGGRQFVSSVYSVIEAGERFTKPVQLSISYDQSLVEDYDITLLGIYGFDNESGLWEYLTSTHSTTKHSIHTELYSLHNYYAVMASNHTEEGSTTIVEHDSDQHKETTDLSKITTPYLLIDDFELNTGQWSNRDGDVGAEVTLENRDSTGKGLALRITNTNRGGNFAVNAVTSSFDAKEYPLIQFDYRISKDVKINILAKVAGRWYEVGFTDDPKILKDKRVNIAHIGDIKGVIADDHWHTVRFDIYEMLRTKTGNTMVEEVIFADWDVPGYMNLKFGNNSAGSYYYIDNFVIYKNLTTPTLIESPTILVDNFDSNHPVDSLGCDSNLFSDGKYGFIEASHTNKESSASGEVLSLYYDVTETGAYAGYACYLPSLDLRSFQSLSFMLKGGDMNSGLILGIKDRSGFEHQLMIDKFISNKRLLNNWTLVTVPLLSFSKDLDWSSIDAIIFAFNYQSNANNTLFIDNIKFDKSLDNFIVQDFERSDGINSLGGMHGIFTYGAAAASSTYNKSLSNVTYGISYGGNIGEAFDYNEGLNHAGWFMELMGINCTECDMLSFRIRGANGDEKPNIYLSDGNFRWPLDIEKYTAITKNWKTVDIPLSDYARYGVDLSHLDKIQFVFEWEIMFGTIYIDDIKFTTRRE